MKKYLLRQKGKEEAIGKYESKIEASDVMESIIEDNNDDLDADDDGYLTAFDFSLEEIEEKDINEVVTNFEEARKYLHGKPNADFTVSKKMLSGNSLPLDGVTNLVKDLNPRHLNALAALNKLFSIADAWNKADGFVPDFSDLSQYKYFPWFVYDKKAAGFVCADASNAATYTNAYIGSRLCFKTANRARQFGEKFADLYNQVFLFK